jgi:hypothetical protein
LNWAGIKIKRNERQMVSFFSVEKRNSELVKAETFWPARLNIFSCLKIFLGRKVGSKI